MNLPHDPAEIAPILEHSERSFSGTEGDARKRKYVFMLYDHEQDRAVGTSMVLGQLGRRDAPYIFFDVRTEERYSETLDRHFVHQLLEIGYSYNGPTEIGGLVMHPDYRRSPEKFGMQVSFARFLWIAMHRADFQNYVLAELMPPLEPDGTSLLWEAIGQHFTGMTYREADRLSRRNKEFIRGLFPDGGIYTSLLPIQAQQIVGQVGRQTKGVEKLLERIGFRYVDRVDPFDGGPHFAAKTDEVLLIERTARCRVKFGPSEGASIGLIARDYDQAPWFRATRAPFRLEEDQAVLSEEVADFLELSEGDDVTVLPLE